MMSYIAIYSIRLGDTELGSCELKCVDTRRAGLKYAAIGCALGNDDLMWISLSSIGETWLS